MKIANFNPQPLASATSSVSDVALYKPTVQRKGNAWPTQAPAPLSFVGRHPQHKVENAVILGAGPTGLATAIKLAQLGVKVTVVEKRDPANPTLPVNFSLRMAFLDRLKDLGAYEILKDQISEVTERARYEGNPPQPTLTSAGFTRGAQAVLVPGSPHAMMDSPVVAMIQAKDLNRGLYQTAQKLGVTFLSHSTAALSLDESTQRYSACAQDKDGLLSSLGTPDLLIVAEGAGSATRESLGIKYEGDARSQEYIGGSVVGAHRGAKGGGYTSVFVTPQDNAAPLRSVTLANSSSDRTWLVVRVPPEKVEGLTKPNDARAFFQERALHMLNKKACELNIEWGANRTFPVQGRIANKAVVGQNVLVVGDAARSAHFLSGAGANLGVVDDVHSVEALVTSARDGLLTWKNALRLFDKRIAVAGQLWLRSSDKYFARPPLL